MPHRIKTIIKNTIVSTGLYKPISNVLYPPRTSLRILSFHKVYNRYDPFFSGVTVGQFKQQLTYLKKHYTVTKLSEALDRIAHKKPFNSPHACITFDDGLQCVYDNAYPILKELNIPATIFLTTGFVDTGNTIWTDHVAGLIKHSTCNCVEIDHTNYPLTSSEQKLYASSTLKNHLKGLLKNERDNIISHLQDMSTDRAQIEYPFLNWKKITQMMDEALIEFGSHTVSHPIMSSIEPQEQNFEISASKLLLEEKLKKPITMFAYPNGLATDYTHTTMDLLKQHNYKYAVLNYGGPCKTTAFSPFEIPRIPETHSNLTNFIWRTAGLAP